MRFYPSLLLWTYVLLPAISLLLAPTLIIALARAHQQRAKVMAHALTARSRAAAALARNQHRRCIPTNRYANGLGQNRPFKFRAKREVDMGVPDNAAQMPAKPKEINNFERKSHWDQQEESLSQLQNMWNMNSFGNSNDGIRRSVHDPEAEKSMEENVGSPYLYGNRHHGNDGKSDYYSGAFSGRNVFDEVLEQSGPVSIEQNENGELFSEARSANPQPTFKKKKKFGKKQDSYHQIHNYYIYYPQPSYGSHYRSAELEDMPQNIPLEADHTGDVIVSDPSNPEEILGNPEPTFKKKKKKKFEEEDEPHYSHNYYHYYYPQPSYTNSYYSPYYRTVDIEDPPQDEPMSDNMHGEIIGDPSNPEEILGNPEPTFKKKKKKKFEEEDEPHYSHNYYHYYYPQPSYTNSYYSPYYRTVDIEDLPQDGPMSDNMHGAIIGEQPHEDMEPKSADPDPTFKKKKKKFGKKHQMDYDYSYPQNYYSSYSSPHYSPYGKESETQETLQNMQEHEMDNVMLGELESPRFADPEPTFKKKKEKKEIEHMPHSFYYPPYQYNSYYPANDYSNSNYNPYARSIEIEEFDVHKELEKLPMDGPGFGKKIVVEMEEKSAGSDVHHSHKKIEKKQGSGDNFFYSSNFYQRGNKKEATEDGDKEVNKLGQEINADLQKSSNQNDQAELNQQAVNIPEISSDKTTSSIQSTETIRPMDGHDDSEDVGCSLEKKLEKKLKKLMSEEKDDYKTEYPYPPMYPPPHQNQYYRSAAETEKTDQESKPEVESQIKVEEPVVASTNTFERDVKTDQESKAEVESQIGVEKPVVPSTITFDRDVTPQSDFAENLQPNEKIDDFNKQISPESIPTRTNIPPQSIVNSRSSHNMVHDHPEDVGCKHDDDIFDTHSDTKTTDPYSYYQRAVEEISEENKKLAEATRKLLHPQELPSKQQLLTPANGNSLEPKFSFLNYDGIPKNDDPYTEQSHSPLVSSDSAPSAPLEEKSANPNADPHHHSHGSSHTHSHFHSHTHGHTRQKNLGLHHGAHSETPEIQMHPTHHQVFPHSQGLSNSGFSQANAKAQTFTHGGVQNSFAHAHSKSFGNSFGSNAATAQAGAQTFDNGFGQSTASAGSTAQNGGPIFGPSAAKAQAGAQTFNNGGFGQSTASASASTQNGGHIFMPSASMPQSGLQPFNNGGFGQTTAQAAAQGFTGPNGGQHFGNGFDDGQDFSFVRQSPEKESFIRPHLNELPASDLVAEMESDMPRFSRSSRDFQDALKGLGLASSIVDLSLNQNRFLDKNEDNALAEGPKDAQNTMGFVTQIVDSGLNAEKANTQNDDISPAKSESARHLTLQGLTSITDLVSKGLRNKREIINEDNGHFANKDGIAFTPSKIGFAQDVNRDNVAEEITNFKTSPKSKVVRTQSSDEVLQIGDQTEDGSGQKETVLGMVDPNTLTTTPEIITNEPWASNWDYKNKRVFHNMPDSKNVPTKNDFNNFDENNSDKGFAFGHFKGENQGTASKNLATVVPVLYKESLNTFAAQESPREILPTNPATQNPNILVHDDVINHISDSTTAQSIYKSKDTITEFPTIQHKHVQYDSPASRKEENDINVARNDSFLGLQHFKRAKTVVPSAPERNEGTNGKSHVNVNIEDAKTNGERASSDRQKLPHLFIANGTEKNIPALTSDEIQDFQFDLPNNSKEATRPGHKNSTEEMFLGLPLQTHKISNTEQSDHILGLALDNNKKINDPSHFHKISPSSTLDLSRNDSIQRIIFNMSGGPFASIEAEMGILTDEEKEAFIRQEVDLISEVIEETFKNKGSISNKHNTTKHIEADIIEDATEKASIVESPNIFQVYGRDSGREEYSRQARSAASKNLHDLLDQHRKKVEKIKNTANEDDDVLMISFIGESVIEDLESRQNKSGGVNQTIHTNNFNQTDEDLEIDRNNLTNTVDEINLFHQKTNETDQTNKNSSRKIKREIRGIRSSRTPLTQLISDPTTKLDVGKTLQNLGNIARFTFENPRAPMYHVRNMLGNAKNSVMSAARVPPNNFLIPSKYEIAKIARNKELNDRLGAINQKMLLSRSGYGNTKTGKKLKESANPPNDLFGFEDTVQKIGGLVRESVQSGKDTVAHVNDVAADAKKLLHTSKYATPRLIVPYSKPMLTSRGLYAPVLGTSPLGTYSLDSAPPNKNTVLITPKIFDIQENILGAAQKNPEHFVGMEHILDATGLSQPNLPEVELQKIEFEPLNYRKPFTLTADNFKLDSVTKPWLKGIKQKTNEENNILGDSQTNNVASADLLQDSEHAANTENLKDFMQRMHDEMREIVRSQYEERKRQRKQRIMNPKIKPNYKKEFTDFKKSTRQTVAPIEYPKYDEDVGQALSPELINLFSERSRSNLKQNFMEMPTVQSRMQEELTNKNFEPLEVSFPTAHYAEKYPYQPQHNVLKTFINSGGTDNKEKVAYYLPQNLMKTFIGPPSETFILDLMNQNTDELSTQESPNSGSTDEAERVAALLPPNLMKPFMGQASETLLHDYLLENGDEEVFPLAKVEPLSSFNNINSQVPNQNSERLSVAPTVLSPNPSTTNIKPEIVGAAKPKTTVSKENMTYSSDLTKETKEFVELLSHPETDGSEISGQSRKSLNDFTAKNKDITESNLMPNKLKVESPMKNAVEDNSENKSTELSTGFDSDKNIQTAKVDEPKNADNVENLKRRPSSFAVKRNRLALGRVPDENDLGYVLGAINPMMFERHFNERLKIKDNSSTDTHNTFLHHGIIKHGTDDSTIVGSAQQDHLPKSLLNKNRLQVEEGRNNQSPVKINEKYEHGVKTKEQQLSENPQDEEIVAAKKDNEENDQQEKENEDDPNKINSQGRLSMDIIEPYQKPFLGILEEDEVNTFLNQYNNHLSEGDKGYEPEKEYNKDESYEQDDVEPVKNVIFSSLEDDDFKYGF